MLLVLEKRRVSDAERRAYQRKLDAEEELDRIRNPENYVRQKVAKRVDYLPDKDEDGEKDSGLRINGLPVHEWQKVLRDRQERAAELERQREIQRQRQSKAAQKKKKAVVKKSTPKPIVKKKQDLWDIL